MSNGLFLCFRTGLQFTVQVLLEGKQIRTTIHSPTALERKTYARLRVQLPSEVRIAQPNTHSPTAGSGRNLQLQNNY